MTSSRDILAAAKAKFPGSFDPIHHDVEMRDALDELYAVLCPPLDADVAAEIEATLPCMGIQIDTEGSISSGHIVCGDGESHDSLCPAHYRDRTTAIFQRHHVAALAREEAGHGETIDERDKRVEQIGQIYRALGGEHHWSNLHDLGDEALELATDLVGIQRQSAQPGSVERVDALTGIRPCPFCGTVPTDIDDYAGDYSTKPDKTWYVNCMSCDVTCYGKGKDAAIAAWNTRTPATSDKEARVKELEDWLDMPQKSNASPFDGQPFLGLMKNGEATSLFWIRSPHYYPDGAFFSTQRTTTFGDALPDAYTPIKWVPMPAHIPGFVNKSPLKALPAAPTEGE